MPNASENIGPKFLDQKLSQKKYAQKFSEVIYRKNHVKKYITTKEQQKNVKFSTVIGKWKFLGLSARDRWLETASQVRFNLWTACVWRPETMARSDEKFLRSRLSSATLIHYGKRD